MNKKILAILLSCAIVIPAFNALAEPQITVILDGEEISYDLEAVISDGEVLLPVRQTLEGFGFDVTWNSFSNAVTAENADTSIVMVMGGNMMLKNSATLYTDVEPQLINGTAMMSAQSVADCLDLSLDWDSDNYILEYTSEGYADTDIDTDTDSDNDTDTDTEEYIETRDISEGDFGMYTGDTVIITAESFDSSRLKWTSTNSSIAAVSEDGTITAKSVGSADIVAYNTSTGKMISCTVTVELAIRPSFKSANISLDSKEEADIGLSVTDGYTARDLEWTIEDDDICTVSSTGKVTGINGGTTVVRATSPTGHYAETTVSVTQPCSTLRLSDNIVIINDNNNGYQLQTIMTPTSANEKITWTSENTEYLQVDQNGVVTAYQSTPKYYKITAKTASGKVATCKVAAKVKAVAADIEVIAINNGADESVTTVNGKTITSYGEPLAITITNNAEAAVSIYSNYHYNYIERSGDKIYAVPVNPESTTLAAYSSNVSIAPGDTETIYFAEYHNSGNAGLVMKSDDVFTFRFTCSGVVYWCYVSRAGTYYFEKG